MKEKVLSVFLNVPPVFEDNFFISNSESLFDNQEHTNGAFSEKWTKAEEDNAINKKAEKKQKEWYLELYGFASEKDLAEYLQKQEVILDAGCGLGYKAAWFAELAPESLVIGMDFSEASLIAARRYKHLKNLYFVRGDIANTGLKPNSVDYVSCDQVIHHTEVPEETFAHLTEITKNEFSCYVYAKKALPRELIDDYFREQSKEMKHDEIWELSKQLTELGENLTNLNAEFECPDIPALGIKGGEYDVQRFIYWNFLKCYWNENLGYDFSLSCNFDWYAPSNAYRYSEEEYRKIISENKLEIIHFHSEEACYSGRFKK